MFAKVLVFFFPTDGVGDNGVLRAQQCGTSREAECGLSPAGLRLSSCSAYLVSSRAI